MWPPAPPAPPSQRRRRRHCGSLHLAVVAVVLVVGALTPPCEARLDPDVEPTGYSPVQPLGSFKRGARATSPASPFLQAAAKEASTTAKKADDRVEPITAKPPEPPPDTSGDTADKLMQGKLPVRVGLTRGELKAVLMIVAARLRKEGLAVNNNGLSDWDVVQAADANAKNTAMYVLALAANERADRFEQRPWDAKFRLPNGALSPPGSMAASGCMFHYGGRTPSASGMQPLMKAETTTTESQDARPKTATEDWVSALVKDPHSAGKASAGHRDDAFGLLGGLDMNLSEALQQHLGTISALIAEVKQQAEAKAEEAKQAATATARAKSTTIMEPPVNLQKSAQRSAFSRPASAFWQGEGVWEGLLPGQTAAPLWTTPSQSLLAGGPWGPSTALTAPRMPPPQTPGAPPRALGAADTRAHQQAPWSHQSTLRRRETTIPSALAQQPAQAQQTPAAPAAPAAPLATQAPQAQPHPQAQQSSQTLQPLKSQQLAQLAPLQEPLPNPLPFPLPPTQLPVPVTSHQGHQPHRNPSQQQISQSQHPSQNPYLAHPPSTSSTPKAHQPVEIQLSFQHHPPPPQQHIQYPYSHQQPAAVPPPQAQPPPQYSYPQHPAMTVLPHHTQQDPQYANRPHPQNQEPPQAYPQHAAPSTQQPLQYSFLTHAPMTMAPPQGREPQQYPYPYPFPPRPPISVQPPQSQPPPHPQPQPPAASQDPSAQHTAPRQQPLQPQPQSWQPSNNGHGQLVPLYNPVNPHPQLLFAPVYPWGGVPQYVYPTPGVGAMQPGLQLSNQQATPYPPAARAQSAEQPLEPSPAQPLKVAPMPMDQPHPGQSGFVGAPGMAQLAMIPGLPSLPLFPGLANMQQKLEELGIGPSKLQVGDASLDVNLKSQPSFGGVGGVGGVADLSFPGGVHPGFKARSALLADEVALPSNVTGLSTTAGVNGTTTETAAAANAEQGPDGEQEKSAPAKPTTSASSSLAVPSVSVSSKPTLQTASVAEGATGTAAEDSTTTSAPAEAPATRQRYATRSQSDGSDVDDEEVEVEVANSYEDLRGDDEDDDEAVEEEEDEDEGWGRVINGEDANITDVPYQVALEYNGRLWCGGSVIAMTWVLSAAHCTEGRKRVAPWRVRAGATVRETGGKVVRVRQLFTHPKYRQLKYDVALFRLSEPLAFSDSIKAVHLPRKGQAEATAGQPVTISGWGRVKPTGFEYPRVLQKATVSIIGRDECTRRYSHSQSQYGPISDVEICAGGDHKDTCQGDSGGPMVDSSGTQVGITSWGEGCANLPGVYSNIANPEMREFIRRITGI